MLVRVLIVDDHATVRQTVRRLLERADDIEVVGEAAGGTEALAAIDLLRPDVVILDVLMPGIDGFEVLNALKREPDKPKVVMLSMNDTAKTKRRALANGASAFVSKKRAFHELAPAVKRAMEE